VELDLGARRVVVEEFAVVGDAQAVARGLHFERVGEAAVAPLEVVTVRFAVGGEMDERGRAARRGAHAALDERVRGGEQPLEGDGARERAVVEEDGEGAAASVAVSVQVGDGRVHAPARDVRPLRRAEGAHARGLGGREDDVAQALLGERVERGAVAGRLGQPERLGLAAEAAAEVGHAPAHLRAAVALVAEGEDGVVVALRDGVAVAAARGRALAVGGEDARVGLRVAAFEPREQRRAEVEAEVRVVVDDALDAAVGVDDAGVAVRAVALGVDALVPVVEGTRARLALDEARPGVLARRLVEVTVYDQRGRHP
jgi:hypothetical protein